MGKKRASKKGNNEEYDDDGGSITSTGTAYSAMMEGGQEFIDSQAEAFSTAIDDTYESRATTREKAWERMVAMLRNGVRQDDCYQSASTLTSRCVNAIKKGGAAEAASAATALALHVLTLGEPNESLFQEVYPDLAKAAKQGKGAAVKVAAADALAVCCFVAAEDEHTTLEVMEVLQGLWGKDSAKLRASALRGWSFLYTSLASPLSSRQLEGQMSALAGLLHDADVEVRAAAGEGLALLYNTCGLGDSDFGDELDEKDEEEGEEEDHGLMALATGSAQPDRLSGQPDRLSGQPDCLSGQPDRLSGQPDRLSGQPDRLSGQPDLAPAGAAVGPAAVGPGPDGVGQQPQQPDAAGLSGQQQQQQPDAAGLSGQQQQQQQPVQVQGLASAGAVLPTPGRRREGDAMSMASCSSVSGLDMVIDRVRDLAANRGDRQRRNKRERVALKGCFRELRSVMEDGHVPEQKIKLRHGDTLVINTMEGNCMMNFLKRFIAGGFQVHLQGNPLLHSIFGFTPLEGKPDKLSAQEKRYFRSPCSAASKARSQARRSQRNFKGAGGEDW